MQIDLTLRDAQRLKGLLENSIDQLGLVDDANYPMRQDDIELAKKLSQAADAHWNK